MDSVTASDMRKQKNKYYNVSNQSPGAYLMALIRRDAYLTKMDFEAKYFRPDEMKWNEN